MSEKPMEKVVQEFLEYKEKYKSSEVYEVLETIDMSNLNEINNVMKFLKNSRIMENMNAENLRILLKKDKKDMREYHEVLSSVLAKTYGEQTTEILNDRPRLTIDDIPSFFIFDEKIREMIGLGGVHTFLNYDMPSVDTIKIIAEHPESIRYYQEFEKMTEGIYPPSAVGLDDRLKAFSQNLSLLKKVIDSGEIDRYKDSLISYMYDQRNIELLRSLKEENPEKFEEIFNIDSLEKLSDYIERKNTYLSSCLEEKNSEGNSFVTIDQMNIILFQHIGLRRRLDGKYMTEKFAKDRSYDKAKFISEYEEGKIEGIDDEEVDLIELSYIYDQILTEMESAEWLQLPEEERQAKTSQVMSGLLDLFRTIKPPLTAQRMEQIHEKVIESYKKRYVDSLFSLKTAKSETRDDDEEKVKKVIKKKGDSHLYFADHKETADGRKKVYKDYIVEEDGNGEFTTREYIEKDGKKFVRTDWNQNKTQYRLYEFKNMVIRYKYSEEVGDYVFEAYNDGEKTLTQRDENVEALEKRIQEGKIVQQYDPEKEYKEGKDSYRFYLVKKVNRESLMLTAVRENRHGGADINSGHGHHDRVQTEKEYEGGLSTRSCYFKLNPEGGSYVFLGFSTIDPNGIVGFYAGGAGGDGGTTHSKKQLHPTMSATTPFSEILDSERGAEIAIMRYEWDIDKIKPGTGGGRVKPDYVVCPGTLKGSRQESIEKMDDICFWAREMDTPAILFEEVENERETKKSIDESTKKRRKTSEYVISARKLLERLKSRQKEMVEFKDVDELGEESEESVEYVDETRMEIQKHEKMIDIDKDETEK